MSHEYFGSMLLTKHVTLHVKMLIEKELLQNIQSAVMNIYLSN